jgi:plasmid stabilization system protein ParE
MYEIKILPLAEIDLDKIYDYYSNLNLNLAVRFYNSILEDIKILAKFPNIAPIETALSNQIKIFRSLIVLSGRLKVIYYMENDCIYITHVWDCRQNPNRLESR